MDPGELLEHGYRYALSLTGDVPSAEDLLQEAWTAVLTARGPLEKPYFFRAIRSRWIDTHRRAQVIRFESVGEPIQSVGPEAERLIEADALWEGLLALREEEREALYLHHVEGWSAREVAERTHRPRNTVLSLLQIASAFEAVRLDPDLKASLLRARRPRRSLQPLVLALAVAASLLVVVSPMYPSLQGAGFGLAAPAEESSLVLHPHDLSPSVGEGVELVVVGPGGIRSLGAALVEASGPYELGVQARPEVADALARGARPRVVRVLADSKAVSVEAYLPRELRGEVDLFRRLDHLGRANVVQVEADRALLAVSPGLLESVLLADERGELVVKGALADVGRVISVDVPARDHDPVGLPEVWLVDGPRTRRLARGAPVGAATLEVDPEAASRVVDTPGPKRLVGFIEPEQVWTVRVGGEGTTRLRLRDEREVARVLATDQ